MSLSDFSDKQKALAAMFGAGILLIIFMLSMVSLNGTNNTLEARLEQEKALHSSLLALKNKALYPKLSSTESKSIIQKTYRKVKEKSIRIQSDNRVVLSSATMLFPDLLNGLNTLKSKHNIIVIQADIKRGENAMVEANITFKHP